MMDPVGWEEWEGRKERDLERKLGEGMELLQFPGLIWASGLTEETFGGAVMDRKEMPGLRETCVARLTELLLLPGL